MYVPGLVVPPLSLQLRLGHQLAFSQAQGKRRVEHKFFFLLFISSPPCVVGGYLAPCSDYDAKPLAGW